MNATLANPSRTLRKLVELLDIPPSYYEKARKRHRSLGEWFCRPESLVRAYAPAVYSQGSFRLGLVIRPILSGEEYDLDTVCELQKLVKTVLTQRDLKALVGREVGAYADAHNIKEPVVERKRCWRLEYADEVKFHVDVLPCVPEDALTIAGLARLGVPQAQAALATALTCTSHPEYGNLTPRWPTTNPGGYGLWFEERMAVEARTRRKQLVAEGSYASVDDVPTYALRTPLQRAIQLLKRHRDVVFKDEPELKPISMIVTTLAALAYEGEADLDDAISGILCRMLAFVRPTRPRVPNPTNPGEDFADKWSKDPNLETNFKAWHGQATRDFAALRNLTDVTRLRKIADDRFYAPMSEADARSALGVAAPTISVAAAPAIHIASAPRPWGTG